MFSPFPPQIYDAQRGYSQSQELDLFGEIAGISFSPCSQALFVGVADIVYGSLLEFRRADVRHLGQLSPFCRTPAPGRHGPGPGAARP